MKLLIAFLVVAATSTPAFGNIKKIFEKDLWWSKKYPVHCEPPFDKDIRMNNETVETKWIEQRLNNFDPQDTRRWQMRYMENNFHFQEGGPIFIDVGGEWTITEGWLLSGHTYDMTRQLNGTLFYTEHRYYGESRPTPDLTNDNLRFLNVDQALADLAHFITEIKSSNPSYRDSGVILVGCSYAGTMVTWFMQKYPHLANGAWSTSAPLEAKVDFVEYKETVSESMEIVGGSNCTRRIQGAFDELQRLLDEGNTSRIEEVFHLCYPFVLNNTLDVWNLFASIASPFSGMVQYYRREYAEIERECEYLVNHPNPNDLEVLASWWWFGDSPPEPEEPIYYCFIHHFDEMAYWYSGTEWDDWGAIFEIKQWYYQTCAEYGWYQSSGGDTIFGSNFPAELYLELCADMYDGLFSHEDVHSNVNRTNVIYGATNPRVRNVYSTHGSLDPWRPMGVQEDINEHSPVTILPLESHCSDMGSIRDQDTPEMRASKERIFELVQEWLRQ